MGVTGLWKLLESSGKPVPLETLENKVLAVDISIWLHQVIKGFQDNKGNALAQAHLLGLFHRLCKLLYYKIKPVFVFDGSTPILKRETIAKRSHSRNQILNEADRLQALLLKSLAKEKIVQQALGKNAVELLSPTKKTGRSNEKPEKEDLFKLPDLPAIVEEDINNTCSTTSWTDSDSMSDSSFDEHNLRYAYNNNIQSIDVNSAEFKNLPPDVRHDILTDIRETRKQSSWGKLHELPAESNKFSSYQMKRLLKRRQVQVSLEEAEKEMGGKTLTLNEMRALLTEDGIVQAASEAANKPIASDENTRFLLVRDLTKKCEQLEKDKKTQPGTSKTEKIANEINFKNEINDALGDEYDEDLELAIKMSLIEGDVYKDEDYNCDSNVKLNSQQRKNFKDSALSLARNYMIEYGGMNDDDIKDLLQQTQVGETTETFDKSLSFMYNKSILTTEPAEVQEIEIDLTKNVNQNPIQIISDSDSDADFEEVEENTTNTLCVDKKLEIQIDLTERLSQEEDIFADIFDVDAKPITLSSCSEIETNQNDENIPENNLDQKFEENKNKDLCKSITNITENLKITKSDSKAAATIEKTTERVSFDDKTQNIISDTKEIDSKLSSNNVIEENNDELSENLEIKSPNINNVSNILQDLQKEVSEITKINLDDIKIDSSAIEIYDSDDVEIVLNKKSPKILNEIIEITDKDDSISKIINQEHKTPSKNDGKIDSFFETKFTVKRTPEKQAEDDVKKLKSPFFINKSSPGSSGKKRKIEINNITSDDDEDIPSKRNSKSSKMLFAEEKIIETINPIELAAKTLKDNKTVDELENIAIDLAQEKRDLEMERNRQDRMGMSITEKMNRECMELLKLFGIPYIIAPMEAEAQCAFLNAIELTDGTITDDSDIWLFGGRTVYKNFFNQKKHVLEYKFENIEKLFNVDRNKLIQLAMLVGSDYTTGISGIGTVTALEILATFTQTPVKENETTEIMSILSSLRKFREWWKNGRTVGPGGKTALKNKLKNIEITEGFPSIAIVEAYLRPTIDENRGKFSWSTPDTESLREFAKKRLGWTRIKTDEILEPVIKKIEEKKTQKSIKHFFNIKNSLVRQDLKVSKRVQNAINKMSADYKPADDEPKIKKSKNVGRKTNKIVNGESSNIEIEKKTKNKRKIKPTVVEPIASTSAESCNIDNTSNIPDKIRKKCVNIPETKEVIPQKERNLIEMKEKKKMAAEIFKKSNSKKK